MMSTKLGFKNRVVLTAVSAGVLLTPPSGGVSADDHENADVLQLQINRLQQEVDQLKAEAAESGAPADDRVLGPREMQSGSDTVSLTISGQVNRGVLAIDDGDNRDLFFVDNDNSSTRIRLIGDAAFDEDISVGSVIEVQFESNSTADVSQNNQRNAGANNFTERKLEIFADSKTYGRLWLGQGDTASNGTSEVDLSGTTVIGYSGVQDFAGGIQFQDDGLLTGISIGDAFDNLDGLSRDDRIRYDTPVFSGAKVSASVIADDRYDAALRYARELAGAHEFEAALGYAYVDDDFFQFNGSASVLLGSSIPGANVTFASGYRNFDDGGRDDASFIYGKLGYLFAPFSIGETALAVDYYYGENIDLNDDEATSVGLLAVQNVDRIGTELYAGLRSYELEASDVGVDDIYGVLVGARLKF